MQNNPSAACELAVAAEPGRGRYRCLIALFCGPLLVYLWLIFNSFNSGGYDFHVDWASITPGYLDTCASYYMGHYGFGLLEYAVVGCGWLLIWLAPVARIPLRSLNLKPGGLGRDLLHALLILLIDVFGVNWISSWLAYALGTPESGIFMLTSAAGGTHPWLLALMAGPYSWLAGGLFEELLRVGPLVLLWKLDNRRVWHFGTVIFAALLFGACHIYQGPGGIISACLLGLLFAAYYALYGRFLPMLLAHAAFDTYAIIYGAIYYTAAWRATTPGG